MKQNRQRISNRSVSIGIVLVLLIASTPQVGFCVLLVTSATDDDATLTLSIEDVIVRGTTGDLGTVQLLVLSDQVGFTPGDSAEISVFEDDLVYDELLWSTSFEFTSAEISAGFVDRTIGFTFDTLAISDPDDVLELFAVAEVTKDACSFLCTNDTPETGILNVTLTWECTEPAECDDSNECTDDDCVDHECVNTCNGTGPADPCCTDPVCQGDPICSTGTCAGSTAASTLGTSPVHGCSALAKHLVYFLLPLGAVIGLGIWRRKR